MFVRGLTGFLGCLFSLYHCQAYDTGNIGSKQHVTMEEFLNFKTAVEKRILEIQFQHSLDAKKYQKELNELRLHHDHQLREHKKQFYDLQQLCLRDPTLHRQNLNEDSFIGIRRQVKAFDLKPDQNNTSFTNNTSVTTNNGKRYIVSDHNPFPETKEEAGAIFTSSRSEDAIKISKPKRNIGDHMNRTAFFVRSGDLSNLGEHQIIAFTNVKTNIGNLYNEQTGVFYCDISGTYVFSVTITTEVGAQIRVALYKNGDAKLPLLSPHLSNSYGTVSGMAILQLERGDSVMVKSINAYSGAVIDNYSYFSGFLLYPAL